MDVTLVVGVIAGFAVFMGCFFVAFSVSFRSSPAVFFVFDWCDVSRLLSRAIPSSKKAKMLDCLCIVFVPGFFVKGESPAFCFFLDDIGLVRTSYNR